MTDLSKNTKEVEDVKYYNSTLRIVKNVIVIGLAFMVQFTAYSGAANLQSSINAEAGLGTASLAAVYAGLIFSNIFLPAVIIKYLGAKWALIISFLMYMPYIAAQLRPTFYTLIPTGILVGLGGGPLWCAKCTYLTIASAAHNKISKIPAEAIFTRFLGIFFMIFQLNQLWGNLISSVVISSGGNEAAVTAINESMIPIVCGANFLPNTDAAMALQPQPPEKIQMLVGIYLACMAGAAIIVAIGVDSTKRFTSDRKDSETGLSGLQLLSVTVKFFAEPYQMMLMIIVVFIGMQQAFFGGDFSASFVSCAIGPGTVGYIMMAFGVSDAVGCIVTGYLAKMIGRVPMISAATIMHTALMATLLAWRPQAHTSYVLYIIAVLWGVCDSIWMVQMNAFFGVLFKGNEEAAFSNFRLWESVGYIIAYVLSPHLRTSSKTYLLLVSMLVGVALYFMVEFKEYKIRKEAVKNNKEFCAKREGIDNIAFQNME